VEDRDYRSRRDRAQYSRSRGDCFGYANPFAQHVMRRSLVGERAARGPKLSRLEELKSNSLFDLISSASAFDFETRPVK
jgi:hypothetical protein